MSSAISSVDSLNCQKKKPLGGREIKENRNREEERHIVNDGNVMCIQILNVLNCSFRGCLELTKMGGEIGKEAGEGKKEREREQERGQAGEGERETGREREGGREKEGGRGRKGERERARERDRQRRRGGGRE